MAIKMVCVCASAVMVFCYSNFRSKLASVRLHNYWNKICEDEKWSRLRNEQLLHEFDNLEMRARELEERLSELSTVNVCSVFCVFFCKYTYLSIYLSSNTAHHS